MNAVKKTHNYQLRYDGHVWRIDKKVLGFIWWNCCKFTLYCNALDKFNELAGRVK